MKPLQLVFPDETFREEWASILAEMEGESINITPHALKHQAKNYEEYLRLVQSYATGVNLPIGRVQAETYFLVRNGEKRILGAIDIRMELNEYLFNYGGNIGYGVRPTERRQGYATEMLSMALEIARSRGLKKVLITCDEDNLGSRRTIEKNGGILENVVTLLGERVMRFWIDLPTRNA
jgi:predicted acetyltransferase